MMEGQSEDLPDNVKKLSRHESDLSIMTTPILKKEVSFGDVGNRQYSHSRTILAEAEEALQPQDTPLHYIEPDGELRQLSPHNIKNDEDQFYPDVDPQKTSSQDETKDLALEVRKNYSSENLGDENIDPRDVESNNSQGSTLFLGQSDENIDGLKDEESNKDLFSTEVDEKTLHEAKEKRKFNVNDLLPLKEHTVPMDELFQLRAGELYETCMFHFAAGNYTGAINCLTRAIHLRPNTTQFFIQRAEMYFLLADFQSAILNYKRACVLEPENIALYYRLAYIYYFQGECLFDQKLFPEALESFARAAEMRTDVPGYHTRSIACLAALQRHGECLALVNKRLETEQENPDLYVMRARLHALFRNTTLSYYDTKDALALDEEHPEALKLMKKLENASKEHKNQAVHLTLVKRYRDALQQISIAIETNPSIANYHVFRGAIHRKLLDFNAAIDDYLLALDKTDHDEESPVYIEAQRQLLLTYNDFSVECFTKGFYEEAIILLNKAIRGEKREKGLYINRGDCFYRQGNIAFSLQDYHQALELDPTDKAIRSRLSILHSDYGTQDYQDKHYLEADSRFTLAIQHDPKVGKFYTSRARARQMLQNESGARQDLLIAIHMDPGNSDITSLMARLFPGKTVKDLLYSRDAIEAKAIVDNLVVTAHPVRLGPIDDNHKSSASKDDFKVIDLAQLESVPSCTGEHYEIKVIEHKRKVQEKIKTALRVRKTLTYDGARIQPLPPPKPYKTYGGRNVQNPKFQREPKGWRKFETGVETR